MRNGASLYETYRALVMRSDCFRHPGARHYQNRSHHLDALWRILRATTRRKVVGGGVRGLAADRSRLVNWGASAETWRSPGTLATAVSRRAGRREAEFDGLLREPLTRERRPGECA